MARKHSYHNIKAYAQHTRGLIVLYSTGLTRKKREIIASKKINKTETPKKGKKTIKIGWKKTNRRTLYFFFFSFYLKLDGIPKGSFFMVTHKKSTPQPRSERTQTHNRGGLEGGRRRRRKGREYFISAWQI